ncbi:helix-turn-helix domain-containing protein [Enterococcus sp. DIV0187]|uniref:helix-turn-helix domain-containing protein n=1 Tax=Enterococcus sp. DIV0187 TaxID=2774644 RepID=UPI003F2214FD
MGVLDTKIYYNNHLNLLNDFIRTFSIATDINISLFDVTSKLIFSEFTENQNFYSDMKNLKLTKFFKKFSEGGPNELFLSEKEHSFFALALNNNNHLIGYVLFGPFEKKLNSQASQKTDTNSSKNKVRDSSFNEKRIKYIFDLFISSSRTVFLEKEVTTNLFFTVKCFNNYSKIEDENSIQNYQIQQAIKYIKSNFHRSITLAETAKHVYFSTYYFGKLFKKETGLTFISYLNHVRIMQAEELLSNTTMSISIISQSVGFSQNSYFCKIFKKIKGISPSQYRKIFNFYKGKRI